MKIFFVIRGLHDHGGIERVTSVVASELGRRSYEVGIICLQKGEAYFPLHESVVRHYLSCSRFSRIRHLKRLYKAERPDIVVFLGSHRSFMNLPAAKGIPSITWEHFNANINWHPLHKLSRRLAVRHCRRIVTLTQRDAQNYANIFGASNAVCIPNPITVENIEISPRTTKRVLAIGRLAGQKGFDMLLDAWSKVEERKKGWNLRIVGSGSHLKRLQQQIQRNGIGDSAEIVPATKDVVSEYKNASMLVMSSRYEGFGLVLLEAMTAGLPIVSFDCEAGPGEIVVHNETGLLLPPEDVNRLAEALNTLMKDKDLQDKFAEKAIERAQIFSVASIITQWENLFHEILKENHGKKN